MEKTATEDGNCVYAAVVKWYNMGKKENTMSFLTIVLIAVLFWFFVFDD